MQSHGVRGSRWTLVLMLLVCMWPSVSHAEPGNWSQRTARLLPAGRAEFLLLGPSRYAFQERVELGISLGAFFVLPNMQLKVALPNQGAWAMATRHRVFAPGVLINVLEGRRPAQVPWRVVLDSDLLMTRKVHDGWVTAQFGGTWLACCDRGELDPPPQRLLQPRVPTTQGKLDAAVRAGVLWRRFMGREGWFVEGEGQVHVVPAVRTTWLEIDAAVGLERRHVFVQFGARSSYDGQELVTLPRLEFGVAIE